MAYSDVVRFFLPRRVKLYTTKIPRDKQEPRKPRTRTSSVIVAHDEICGMCEVRPPDKWLPTLGELSVSSSQR